MRENQYYERVCYFCGKNIRYYTREAYNENNGKSC